MLVVVGLVLFGYFSVVCFCFQKTDVISNLPYFTLITRLCKKKKKGRGGDRNHISKIKIAILKISLYFKYIAEYL